MPATIPYDIPTPALVIDETAVKRNINRLAEYGKKHKIGIRPHTKTHKSLRMGRAQLDAGAVGLTVAKVGEAEVMAKAGGDLLIAYPTAHRGALAELGQLDSERPPILMVDSVAHLDLIENAVGRAARPVRICIDLDVSWWPLGGRLKIGVKRSPIRTKRSGTSVTKKLVEPRPPRRSRSRASRSARTSRAVSSAESTSVTPAPSTLAIGCFSNG